MTQEEIFNIANKKKLLIELSEEKIANFCIIANNKYREGNPIISDEDYDFVFLAELKKRNPNHFLIKTVESENKGFSEIKIKLPERMLSTDKAYSWEEIKKWLERIQKAAKEISLNVEKIKIKGTAKLDGFAGYDDGKILYTRGDGRNGSDISRVFSRGLKVYNDSQRGQGAGEIVVKKSYFDKKLSDDFEYPRNFQASLIKEKELNIRVKQAIIDKAVFFVPFIQLYSWFGDIDIFINDFNNIVVNLESSVDFHTDGVVFEITNAELKSHMGSNKKFHRWQIAFKENKDKAQVSVLSVTAQVGRTGKITPVAELQPTKLSGATIYRATCHHYGLVKEQKIGTGSVVELTRSGLVIPKINKVLKGTKANIPSLCPSCQTKLIWSSDFLICSNHNNCPDQIVGGIVHFFKVLSNNNGFGIASIKKLYKNGIDKISLIYALSYNDLRDMGFGEKTAENLLKELNTSREVSVEDWRFLAAFGVLKLGSGNCENILKYVSIDKIFSLSAQDIANIEGFAEISADFIAKGLKNIKIEFDKLIKLGFTIEKTEIFSNKDVYQHIFFNKRIVFTGKMNIARSYLEKQAKSIGINVANVVNSKTDFLIIGDNVGITKLNKAREYKVEILTEKEYKSYLSSIKI